MKSDCLFAKKSLIWGSDDYDTTLTIEENLRKSLQALVFFTLIGEEQHLDGFLVEIKVLSLVSLLIKRVNNFLTL